jgi:hypothetical protein
MLNSKQFTSVFTRYSMMEIRKLVLSLGKDLKTLYLPIVWKQPFGGSILAGRFDTVSVAKQLSVARQLLMLSNS